MGFGPGHSRIARRILIIALCIACTPLLAAAFWPHVIERFIFMPRILPEAERSPAVWGYSGDETWLRTADGEDLHGWMLRSTAAVRSPCTVLFLHGNAGNVSSHAGFLRPFNAAGFDALLFDYRGYGASTGRPSEQGLYTDAGTAWQYLRDSGIDPDRIIVVAHSLGTAVATHLTSRAQPAAVVLAAPFASLPHAVDTFAPWIPVGLLSWNDVRFDSADRIPQIRSPVMVVVGSDDMLVLEESSRSLFEQAPEPRLWLDVPGGHNQVFGSSEFKDVLDGLLELAPVCTPQ